MRSSIKNLNPIEKYITSIFVFCSESFGKESVA
jgi:hypothetical protein